MRQVLVHGRQQGPVGRKRLRLLQELSLLPFGEEDREDGCFGQEVGRLLRSDPENGDTEASEVSLR